MPSKVVVICCNWNGWSCLETAASSGLHYPASVRIIRVSCLSRLHAGLILKAFEFKADGVMLVGCEEGSCQFGADSECIGGEYDKTQIIMGMLGIRRERLALVRLPAFDGNQFVARIAEFVAEIGRIPAARRTRKTSRKAAPVAGLQER